MPTAKTHITIEQNTEILKRFAFLERSAMRALAGWLPGVPEWEAKNEFGLHIWESADNVETIYQRLRELRSYAPERGLGNTIFEFGKELEMFRHRLVPVVECCRWK